MMCYATTKARYRCGNRPKLNGRVKPVISHRARLGISVNVNLLHGNNHYSLKQHDLYSGADYS